MPDSQTAPSKSRAGKSKRSLHWSSPRVVFTALSFAAALALSMFTRSLTGLSFAWSYLIGINVVTFLMYFYDKSVAKIGFFRIPEFALHAVTVGGGTPAAFLGQNLFHHKTVKGSFRRVFWLIVVGQFIVFGLWIYLSRE